MAEVVKLGGPRPDPGKKKPATAEAAGTSELLTPRNMAIGGGVLAVLLGVGLWFTFGQGGGTAAVTDPAALAPGSVDVNGPVAADGAMPAGMPAEAGGMAPAAAPGMPAGGMPNAGAGMPGAGVGTLPPEAGGIPGAPNMGQGATGASVTTAPGAAVPGSPGMGANPDAGMQYGPRPPVEVQKPGGGSWKFQPREDPS